MSYSYPQGRRIDMELLLQWEDYSKSNIKSALKEVMSCSLLKMTNYRDMNSKSCAFTMHPIVQYAIKKRRLGKNLFIKIFQICSNIMVILFR